MTNKDDIKELFSKGLQDHQVSVDPALWSSISSSLGTSAAKTGLSILSKTLIGFAASSIIGVAVYFSVQNTNTTNQKIDKEQKAITPQPVTTTPEADNTLSNELNSKEEKNTTTYQSPQTSSGLNIPIIDDSEFENQHLQQQAVPNQAIINHPHVTHNQALTSSTISGLIQNSSAGQVHNTSTQLSAPSRSQNVGVNQVLQTEKPKRIVLPNIFTPNGDGQNETLQINWQQADVQDFSIVVLDAKNNVVYKDSNPQFEWDGTDLGGEKLSRGTYIYFVAAVLNGQKWQQSSSLQIQY